MGNDVSDNVIWECVIRCVLHWVMFSMMVLCLIFCEVMSSLGLCFILGDTFYGYVYTDMIAVRF